MSVDEVLDFWFGVPATDAPGLMAKMKRWYQGGPALDEEIRAKFLTEVETAVAGGLEEWTATLRGRLALVILLDQFTRSVYRGDARTYAGDARAQSLALGGLSRLGELPSLERNFLLMPLVHAEDLALQERGVAEVARVVEEAAEWQRPILAMGIEQTRKYRDVIARFGRFPHRNQILGRTSTPEEEEFLVDWAKKQAPAAMRG
jgi:uncharacterized protein (DUF924 family)